MKAEAQYIVLPQSSYLSSVHLPFHGLHVGFLSNSRSLGSLVQLGAR